MALKSDVILDYSVERPIDLEIHIDKQLQASDLLVTALRRRDSSPDSAALLAEILVARNQLLLLRSHISTTYGKVLIDPADDDYLILRAIDARLDNAMFKNGIAHAPLDDIGLLVNTIRRAVQIADRLTAP